MLHSLTTFLAKLWNAWAGLFSGLPNGDPYIAFVVLFALFCMALATLQRVRVRLRGRRVPEMPRDRFELLCKVMNIRL